MTWQSLWIKNETVENPSTTKAQLWWILFKQSKNSKWRIVENSLSTIDKYGRGEEIRSDTNLVQSGRQVLEWMVFATSSKKTPQQLWQSMTCSQCCIKTQSSMPEWQNIKRNSPITRVDWMISRFREGQRAMKASSNWCFCKWKFPIKDKVGGNFHGGTEPITR